MRAIGNGTTGRRVVDQLRPLRPAIALGGLVAVWLLGNWMIPGEQPPGPEVVTLADVTLALALLSVTLGTAVAFMAGRDVDVAEPLLFSLPYSHWRTIVWRELSWVAGSIVIVLLLARRGGQVLDLPPGPLQAYGLVLLAFAASLALLWSRLLGALFGGAGALLTVCALTTFSAFRPEFPVRLLAEPGSRAFDETAVLLWLCSGVLTFSVLFALHRPGAGRRVGLRA